MKKLIIALCLISMPVMAGEYDLYNCTKVKEGGLTTNHTIRCENKEVVCYSNEAGRSGGISCFKK